jgi:hypothetical protein
MCFVSPQYIPVIAVTSINQLVFIVEMDSIICEAGTEIWCYLDELQAVKGAYTD